MGGLPDAPNGAYIRACTLSGFAEIVRSKGGDPIAMLERAGMDPDALSAPEMLISFARAGALVEMAAEELGAVSFGLEWALGTPLHFPNSGPMLLLKEDAATFAEWVWRSTHYWRPGTSGIIPQIVDGERPGVAAFRVAPARPVPVPRQQMEYIFGGIVRLSRAVLADEGLNPVRVRFSHREPQEISLHERIFRCPVEFEAEQDEILFDGTILTRQLHHHATLLEETMDQFLRHRIALLPRYNPSVSTSTALAIRTVLGAGLCSREFIARSLRASPRKLQRLLAQEDTTYEDILDRVRKEMAGRLLADTAAPISTIAGMLEFASAAAMTLAVRRWTGMTPSAYRASLQAAAVQKPAA